MKSARAAIKHGVASLFSGYRFGRLHPRGNDLRDIEQLRGIRRHRGQRIAEHCIAEGTRGGDHAGSGSGQLSGPVVADPLAFFLTEEGESASGAAAKAALSRARRILRISQNDARFVIYAAIATQITRVVIDDRPAL